VDSVEDNRIVAIGTAFDAAPTCLDWFKCEHEDSVCTREESAELFRKLQHLGSTILPDGPGLRRNDRYLTMGPRCPETHSGAIIERFLTLLNPRDYGHMPNEDNKPAGGWTWHGMFDYDQSKLWYDEGTERKEMTPVVLYLDTDNIVERCEKSYHLYYAFILSISLSFLIPCCLLWICRRTLVKGKFKAGHWYVPKNDIGELVKQQEKKDLKRRKEFTTDVDQDILLFPPCTEGDEDADLHDYEADALTVWHYKGGDNIPHGPHSAAEMRDLVAQGRIKPHTKIRRGSWREYCTVTRAFPRARQDMSLAFCERPPSEEDRMRPPSSSAPVSTYPSMIGSKYESSFNDIPSLAAHERNPIHSAVVRAARPFNARPEGQENRQGTSSPQGYTPRREILEPSSSAWPPTRL